MFRLLCIDTMALLSLVLQVCNDSLLIFILFFTKQASKQEWDGFPCYVWETNLTTVVETAESVSPDHSCQIIIDQMNLCSGNYWVLNQKVHILQPVLVTGSLINFRSYNRNSANIYHHLMIVTCHNLCYNVCKRNMKHLMIF